MRPVENLFRVEMKLRVAANEFTREPNAKTRAKLRRAARDYANCARHIDEHTP